MNQSGAARYARFKSGFEEPVGPIRRLVRALTKTPVWPVLQPFFSFGVWVSSLLVLLFTATVSILISPIATFNQHHDKFGAAGMGLGVVMTGSKIKMTYHPDFDPDRRSMFCQNHVSVLDGLLACAVIPHAFCGLMIHWHFHIPGYGWIMRISNGIPVYPAASGRTAEITEAAKERVGRGISILVFPEAHRTLDGLVQPFKRGVFFMARDAGIPVVPFAVRGLQDVNRKGQFHFRPGEIEVYLGAQIDLKGMSDEEITEVAAHMTTIAQTWVAGEDPSDVVLELEAA